MIQANSTQGSGDQRTQCGLAQQHLWPQLPKSEKQGISHSSAPPPLTHTSIVQENGLRDSSDIHKQVLALGVSKPGSAPLSQQTHGKTEARVGYGISELCL